MTEEKLKEAVKELLERAASAAVESISELIDVSWVKVDVAATTKAAVAGLIEDAVEAIKKAELEGCEHESTYTETHFGYEAGHSPCEETKTVCKRCGKVVSRGVEGGERWG